ncbi:MAG: gliding motility-associated-like protein, partial [Crocinitomicaceae bacterium]
SNEAKTIFLEVQLDDVAKKVYINWSPYSEFNGSIKAYNVYRIIDGAPGSAPITTLSSIQWSYEDDVNDIISTGDLCYYVEAIEALNIHGIAEISRSNIECVVLPPLIYIPNAFWPDGINKVFKPIISDFDASAYDFTVFNRWGQVIFQTNYYAEGWDGMINYSNEMAATGTYLYMVTVKDANGIEIVKRGHVSLLK